MKSFNARVALSEKISEEIQQWIENLMLSKRTTAISPPTQLIVLQLPLSRVGGHAVRDKQQEIHGQQKNRKIIQMCWS